MKEYNTFINLKILTIDVLMRTKTQRYLIERYQDQKNINSDISEIVSLLSKKNKYSKSKFNKAFSELKALFIISSENNKNLIFEYAQSLVLKKIHYHFYEE